jgi:predicted ABC-type ATPase/predicted transcriptional regulator of viral defense system
MPTSERALIAKLARASKSGVISVIAAARALDSTESSTAIRMARLTRRGWLRRVRRGLYLILPLETEPGHHATAEDPWVLAQQLFEPCYIGGWSAAEHWNLTEQLFRSTLVVTSASVRATNVERLGHAFRLFRAPRARLAAGVAMEWRGKERVAVSGLERTVIDCLRNPELCGGARHLAQILQAYGESPKHDFARLVEIGRHVGLGATWKRLGYLAERLWPNETALLSAARRHVSAGNARLDPSVHRTGRLVTKWRLFVNVKTDAEAREPWATPLGPRIIIIAGPNGAGKSTFAREFLPREAGCPVFVNADLIAAGLSPFAPNVAALRAGRIMIDEIRNYARREVTFAFETTLAGRSYARLIPRWQSAGYRVDLVFLRVRDVEMAVDRVAARVAQGGHAVPDDVVRRRFAQGWTNFERVYQGLVDSWRLYDNSGDQPSLIEEGAKA